LLTSGDVARLLFIGCVVAWVAAFAWLDLGGEGRVAWMRSQTVLSVAGLIVGFIVLSWQLKRQHWNTLENNRRQSQDRLKVELYSKIADRIEATAFPLRDLAPLPSLFIHELRVRVNATDGGARESSIFPQIEKSHEAATQSITALISVLETYAIAMSESAGFRRRLKLGLLEIDIELSAFRDVAWQFVASHGSPALRWPPTTDDFEALSRPAAQTDAAATSLSGVVTDLRVEAQNSLLGSLFPETRVPPRAVPTEPM